MTHRFAALCDKLIKTVLPGRYQPHQVIDVAHQPRATGQHLSAAGGFSESCQRSGSEQQPISITSATDRSSAGGGAAQFHALCAVGLCSMMALTSTSAALAASQMAVASGMASSAVSIASPSDDGLFYKPDDASPLLCCSALIWPVR